MMRAASYRRSVMKLLMLLAIVASCGTMACKSECERNSDCVGVGKGCALKESWCEKGSCRDQCPARCKTDIVSVNSCPDDHGICTDNGRDAALPPVCTVLPIICQSSDDCPVYRPLDPDGGLREWACTNGVCEYPSLTYVKGVN